MSRMCKAHGKKLKKTLNMGTGEYYWYCPKDGCSYRENAEGERI